MDILIKNIEMPRGDDIISAYIHSDGSVSYVYVNEDIPSVTMATGLPEHGDLIDRDKLSDGIYHDIDELYYAIDKAPVIVEATE